MMHSTSYLFRLQFILVLFWGTISAGIFVHTVTTRLILLLVPSNKPSSVEIVKLVSASNFDKLSRGNIGMGHRRLSFLIYIMKGCEARCRLSCCNQRNRLFLAFHSCRALVAMIKRTKKGLTYLF